MAKQKKVSKSIEKIDVSIDRNRENLTILKWIDSGSFDKLIKWFSGEKEQNKVVLSWFLNSTNVTLWKLWNIKIDINHIKNYIRNKPDISKDLEKKIAKLFLKKLYESGATNLPFIVQLKDAFGVENKADIESKSIDFKTIQVNISKLSPKRDENINSVTVSNDEIFDLFWNNINKITNFQSQTLEFQQIILDLLQFEVKDVINDVQLWWKSAEVDMENLVLPANSISEIFDEVKDPEILQLNLEKSGIVDILNWGEKWIATKEKTFWKNYINRLEKQWLSDDYITKLKHLLLWKIEYHSLKHNLKTRIESINKQIWKKYIENFEKLWKDPEFISILEKLNSSSFDFSKLDKKEQSLLWQNLIISKYDKKENSRAKHIWLNQDDFKNFLKTLYDF